MQNNNNNNNNQNQGPRYLYNFDAFFKDDGQRMVTLGFNKNSGKSAIATYVRNQNGFDWQNPEAIATFSVGQGLEIVNLIKGVLKSRQPAKSTQLIKDGQIDIHIVPSTPIIEIWFEKIINNQVEPRILIMNIVNNQELMSVVELFQSTSTYIATRLALENHPGPKQHNNNNNGGWNNNNNNNQNNGGWNNNNQNNQKPSYWNNNKNNQQPQQNNQQQPQQNRQPQQNNQQQKPTQPPNNQPNNIVDDDGIF